MLWVGAFLWFCIFIAGATLALNGATQPQGSLDGERHLATGIVVMIIGGIFLVWFASAALPQ